MLHEREILTVETVVATATRNVKKTKQKTLFIANGPSLVHN